MGNGEWLMANAEFASSIACNRFGSHQRFQARTPKTLPIYARASLLLYLVTLRLGPAWHARARALRRRPAGVGPRTGHHRSRVRERPAGCRARQADRAADRRPGRSVAAEHGHAVTRPAGGRLRGPGAAGATRRAGLRPAAALLLARTGPDHQDASGPRRPRAARPLARHHQVSPSSSATARA